MASYQKNSIEFFFFSLVFSCICFFFSFLTALSLQKKIIIIIQYLFYYHVLLIFVCFDVNSVLWRVVMEFRVAMSLVASQSMINWAWHLVTRRLNLNTHKRAPLGSLALVSCTVILNIVSSFMHNFRCTAVHKIHFQVNENVRYS